MKYVIKGTNALLNPTKIASKTGKTTRIAKTARNVGGKVKDFSTVAKNTLGLPITIAKPIAKEVSKDVKSLGGSVYRLLKNTQAVKDIANINWRVGKYGVATTLIPDKDEVK